MIWIIIFNYMVIANKDLENQTIHTYTAYCLLIVTAVPLFLVSWKLLPNKIKLENNFIVYSRNFLKKIFK